MKKLLVSMAMCLLAAGPVVAGETRNLSLGQALSELDAGNLVLAEARGRVEQARSLVGQSTAALLPSVLVAGGYTRNSDDAVLNMGNLFQKFGQEPPPGIPTTIYMQPIGVWTVSGSIKVPLLAPSAWADRAAAQHGTEAATAAAAAMRLQLRGALVQAAWAAAAFEEVVAASERAVGIAEEHRQSAARKVTAGEAAPLSVLKADTEVVKRGSDLVRARAELERTRLALGVLLGKSEPVRVLLETPSGGEVPLPSDTLTGEAFDKRPELQSGTAKLRAAEAQVLSARLRLLPQISGTATAFAADMPYPTGKKDGWRVTLDASWLLWDGGLRSGRRAQAQAEADMARVATDSTRLAIAQEVADAVRDVGVAAERLRLAEQQCSFANEAAASAKRTYEAGVTGSFDVLDANDRLYQADIARADARGRLGIARASLDKALGRDVGR
jgi:outer membrane protein TolC